MPATTTTAETVALTATQVIVHPLVLLSAVDHYNRTAKGTKKRVVGILLGQNNGTTVNVANSFAVPFEEDDKDPGVWFLDHNYVEAMNEMFKKINAREKLIGWYHSGPKLRGSDVLINDLLKKYVANPILVIVHIQQPTATSTKEIGIPTDAYFAVEEIKDDGTTTSKTFVHVPSVIDAEESEEIGVEHLLRDLKESTGDLTTRITGQLESLRGLQGRLSEIATYLDKVLKNELPVNHSILEVLQDIFNLLPNITPAPSIPFDQANVSGAVDKSVNNDLMRSFRIKTNDQLMAIYISSLIRAVIALHDLIDSGTNTQRHEETREKLKEKESEGEKKELNNERIKDDKGNDKK